MRSRFTVRVPAALMALCACVGARAAADPPPAGAPAATPSAATAETAQKVPTAQTAQTVPSIVTLGFDPTRLPGGETMGLLGASDVMELAPGWWVGPALYGAASGRRGGLFTWGVEGQRRWRLSDRWALVGGLYAGGGGGAGAPVGGGLMLRPHADLVFDFGPWGLGLSASQLRFPSGAIASTQVGLMLDLKTGFSFTAPGAGRAVFADAGGVGAERMDVGVGQYAAGAGPGRPLVYLGARMERRLAGAWSATFEAHGAATGGADGYAEVLGGVLALWPAGTPALRLGGHAALGLGGGGAVPTGGGPIAKLGVTGRLQLGPQWSLDLDVGQARATGGDFKSRYARLSLGMAFGVPAAAASAGDGSDGMPVHDMAWALSLQSYVHAQRKDGGARALSTIGFKFSRALGEHLYLSGQAHSASTGGAGAYSVGLVGLGVATHSARSERWSVGAEALVGAGGGGGVASQGGAIAQPMAWVGRDVGRYNRFRLGAGYVKSARGALSSPVLDATWAVEFGVP